MSISRPVLLKAFLLIAFVVFFSVPIYISSSRDTVQDYNGADGKKTQLHTPPNEKRSGTYKILYIMSYHSPWEWTDKQFEGFRDALQDCRTEYKVFQMDMKNRNSQEWLQSAVRSSKELIDGWKPDLVYLTDDEALKYVASEYKNTGIPFVFSGVNTNPKQYGLENASNITGVLEVEHFVQSIRVLKEIVPEANRVAVITDDAQMWIPVIERMKEKARNINGMRFTRWDTVHSFEEYKAKILDYGMNADAVAMVGIFNFKDKEGRNVFYQDVLKWTAENSRLPDLSFWSDRVDHGTLCAVAVSAYQQGLAAGKMAYRILTENVSPSDMGITATTKGEPYINLARANMLGIKIKSIILLNAKVYKNVE